MVAIQQGLRADGVEVSMEKLCRWFGAARRSVYDRPTKALVATLATAGRRSCASRRVRTDSPAWLEELREALAKRNIRLQDLTPHLLL